jgi:hypothetical protein
VNRARRPPLQHPLTDSFDRAVASLGAALNPETIRHYRGTVRNFLSYLGTQDPEVNSLTQLRRDPHIIEWMSHRRSQTPPLTTASYINLLIALRWTFHELAWMNELPELAHLIRREDIPRLPYRLLSTYSEQDQLLQQGSPRNDLGANVFLLIRHTGMRTTSLRLPPFHRRIMGGPRPLETANGTVGTGGSVRLQVRPEAAVLRSLEQLADDEYLLPRPPLRRRRSTAPRLSPSGLS